MKWNLILQSKEEKELGINFSYDCLLLNFSRIRLFNFIFFLCNGIILIINFFNRAKGIGNKNPISEYYIPTYWSFLCIFLIMSGLSFLKPPKTIEQIRWWHKVQIYFFSIILILWVTSITFIDLRVNGGITVYALGLLGLAVILFLNFIWGLLLYFSAGIIFINLLQSVNMPEDKFLADYLNGMIMIVVSFLISQIIYLEKKRQFIKDNLILKQKQELEKINRDLNSQNLKNEFLQIIIQNYVPHTTWKKADLNSSISVLEIPEEEIEITCLFLDIVGFTAYSEMHSPREVIERLNELFIPIVKIIYKNKGDIDKFIGDAIFAVFENPEMAVKSAYQIMNNLKEKNSDEKMLVRIGIHTGRVIRGDVGGEQRRDNTLIGDTVNIASRLQSSCEPGEIIVSETTHDLCKDIIKEHEKTSISLKGKTLPLNIYRIKNINLV